VRRPVVLVVPGVRELASRCLGLKLTYLTGVIEDRVHASETPSHVVVVADSTSQPKADRENAVLEDVGLELVIPTFETIDPAEVAFELLERKESAADHGQRFLVDNVVLEKTVPDEALACLCQKEAEQVDESTLALDGELTDRREAGQGIEAARVVEHLEDSEIATNELRDHSELEAFKANNSDPRGCANADAITQIVDLEPTLAL